MEPKIRFKGFEGEWKKTIYGNHIVSTHTGTNLLGEVSNKGIPLLKMGNIQRGFFDLDKMEYLTANQNPPANCIANFGDFFYNTRNTLELVGKGATWMKKDGIYAFNSNIAICKLDGIDTFFFNYLYNTVRSIKQVQARAKGTTSVAAVYLRDLMSIKLALPHITEQKTIASYFTSLDSQISASTSRLASLKQMKAASLQAMFPQEGETVPKVRFKGFEGEWKKVKFSDIACVFRGLTYTPNDIVKDGVRVLRSSNIDEDTFVLTDSDVFVSYECVNIDHIHKNDILITAANGSSRLVGKHTLVKNLDNKMQVAGGFMLKVISNESEFLNASMNTCWYKRVLQTCVAGGNGAIGNLNKNDLSNTSFYIPKEKEERDAIASYFTSLDRQITLQTQRLEKLKQIKSACLDKMFV